MRLFLLVYIIIFSYFSISAMDPNNPVSPRVIEELNKKLLLPNKSHESRFLSPKMKSPKMKLKKEVDGSVNEQKQQPENPYKKACLSINMLLETAKLNNREEKKRIMFTILKETLTLFPNIKPDDQKFVNYVNQMTTDEEQRYRIRLVAKKVREYIDQDLEDLKFLANTIIGIKVLDSEKLSLLKNMDQISESVKNEKKQKNPKNKVFFGVKAFDN